MGIGGPAHWGVKEQSPVKAYTLLLTDHLITGKPLMSVPALEKWNQVKPSIRIICSGLLDGYIIVTQNKDVMTTKTCSKYNHLGKPLRVICMDGLT